MSSTSAASRREPATLTPRFTIRQMMILTVLVAVTCAIVAPILRTRWAYWQEVWLFLSLVLPLVWALIVVVLVRRGPVKDWGVLCLLFIPLGVVLGGMVIMEVLILWSTRSGVSRLVLLAPMVAADAAAAYGFAPWFRRMVPKRCPSCRRLGLLRDLAGDSRSRSQPRDTHWCFRCGDRVRRWLGGEWEPA